MMNNDDKTEKREWVIAEAPARVDLSGGYSDTPPITYEHGGVVINAAVKVDGVKPIRAKIRKIKEFEVVFVVEIEKENVSQTVRCRNFEEMEDYCDPDAPGALLKAAFLCTKTVTFPSSQPLAKQLQEKHGCGFEIHTWSNLHKGSGLGTSSILAGALCAVIMKITSPNSYEHDQMKLLKLVFDVEQKLTTGGGWQDQVGGILPGVKITTSPPKKALEILPTILKVSDETLQKVNSNMVLIYTGETRLAKDILQKAIKLWNERSPQIVENVDNLTKNAELCAEAMKQGDLTKIGLYLNEYREQKKIMTPGSETEEIRQIIDKITPHIHGCCFAGAGGGGYLIVLTKEPNFHERMQKILQDLSGEENQYTVHKIEVDKEGLTINFI